MSSPRRVAVMLDLKWPYKRHADVFAGMQRYSQEQGCESIIDEYADDTIPIRPAKTVPYDGVIARATRKLARRAARSKQYRSFFPWDRLPACHGSTTRSVPKLIEIRNDFSSGSERP